MSAPSSLVRRSTGPVRKAFTLVEILVVITIIGILAGLAVPALFRVLVGANESVVQTELMQIDASVGKFKNEIHLTPPRFGSNIMNVVQMRRFLNKISPNNVEARVDFAGMATPFNNGAGNTRLEVWWTNVGSQLVANPDASLTFFLSGLFNNKQYPLTGSANAIAPVVAYNEATYIDGSDASAVLGDRRVFFEFKALQKIGNVAKALPPRADDAKDTAYRYVPASAYTIGNAYHIVNTNTMPFTYKFANATTFQIYCPGSDEEMGTGFQALCVEPCPMPTGNVDTLADDNITNFAPGRLEKFIGDNQ